MHRPGPTARAPARGVARLKNDFGFNAIPATPAFRLGNGRGADPHP